MKYLFLLCCILLGCSPITPPIAHQYQLVAYSHKNYPHTAKTILVTMPEAVDDYKSSDMKYTKNKYDLKSYSKNAWSTSPAKMLYPLLIQSLQASHHFHAVIAGYWADSADYRIDSQILEFKQDFTTVPSQFHFKAKVTITQMDANQILLTKILSYNVRCNADNPYGGVVAANRSTLEFTQAATKLAIRHT